MSMIDNTNTTPATDSAKNPAQPTTATEQDREFIELCAQHIANHRAFNACHLDDDESPHWPPYEHTRDAISKAHPATLAGVIAKAKAAIHEDDGNEYPTGRAASWAMDIARDLVRLELEGVQ